MYAQGEGLVRRVARRRAASRQVSREKQEVAALEAVRARTGISPETLSASLSLQGELMTIALELLMKGVLGLEESPRGYRLKACPCPKCAAETPRVLRGGLWVCDHCGTSDKNRALLGIDQGPWGGPLRDPQLTSQRPERIHQQLLKRFGGGPRLELVPYGDKLFWRLSGPEPRREEKKSALGEEKPRVAQGVARARHALGKRG